jgi:hypothetical protein
LVCNNEEFFGEEEKSDVEGLPDIPLPGKKVILPGQKKSVSLQGRALYKCLKEGQNMHKV